MKIWFTLFVFIIICFFNSCRTNQSTTLRDTNHLYKKSNTELNAGYSLYHVNDSISYLYYHISNENSIYKKADTSSFFYSHLKITYSLIRDPNSTTIIDSGSVFIYDKQAEVRSYFLDGYFPIKLKYLNTCYIDITVYDIHKKTKYNHQLYADKQSRYTRQNFLVSTSKNKINTSYCFKLNDTVYLKSARTLEKKAIVDVFSKQFEIAAPPFSTKVRERFNYIPDSTFSLNLDTTVSKLCLTSKGLYHIRTNQTNKNGVSLFVYESVFPKISDANDMILATRYIMSKKEFQNCESATNKKQEIDNFWVSLAGSNERAKELIRKYYIRVQEANKLFTSYHEGWKTDRGMIYIVYGAPNVVYKNTNGETWIYGENKNPHSINFSFNLVENPFSDNDYILERNPMYKDSWYQAVDFWRQGRVYLND